MDLVPTIFIYSRQVSRHSGRVVIELDRFIYLGESFEAIIEEHEIDPINYNKVMSDVDTHLRQKAMEEKVRIYIL